MAGVFISVMFVELPQKQWKFYQGLPRFGLGVGVGVGVMVGVGVTVGVGFGVMVGVGVAVGVGVGVVGFDDKNV